MNELVEKALEVLREYVADMGGTTKAANALGMSYQTLNQWLKGTRKPSMAKIAPVLEKIGVKFVKEGEEASRDVCFVDAKVVNAPENGKSPKAYDYTAAPLVGEVGAGTGYIDQESIESWFLVYSNLPAVRYRKNLIAVKIGPKSTSMKPTLNPDDIVLIDRDDRDVSTPGRMMLVKDPSDGSGMIKRVNVQELKNDFQITYYSDNAAQWPPMVYSLNNDFDGDWDKAIVGRVIWAWQDMREK